MSAVMYPFGTSATPLQLQSKGASGGGDVEEVVFTTSAVEPPPTFSVPTMYLNFVVFGSPADNSASGSPSVPTVSIQHFIAGMTYTELVIGSYTPVPTSVPPAVGPAATPPVDVELLPHPSGLPGVYQLKFAPRPDSSTGAFYDLNGQTWKIQFANQDAAPVQVTFIVDSVDSQAPWIAVPLSTSGPINFGAATALTPLTLDASTIASSTTWSTSVNLVCNESYDLSVPVYNYGTSPLAINIPADITSGAFTLKAATFSVDPGAGGGASAKHLTVRFTAPATPGVVPATGASTLAVPSADTVHPATFSFSATVGTFEFVFVLDMSGSMATVDTVSPPKTAIQTRWNELKDGAAEIFFHLKKFVGNQATWAAALYPAPGGEKPVLVIQKQGALTASSTFNLDDASYGPANGTPMAAGIYAGIGPQELPTATVPGNDCGQLTSNDSVPDHALAYQYNHRFMILMTDGVNNIGDDPNTFPDSYYVAKNVKAMTVGYGNTATGQFNEGTLAKVASASHGKYFVSNPMTAMPDTGLGAGLVKAIVEGLGLTFISDPAAVLAFNADENRHPVIVTEYDSKVAFSVNCITQEEGAAVHVELITPLGERITPDNAYSFGVSYAEGSLFKSYFVDITAQTSPKSSPRYGTWILVISRAQPSSPPILEISLQKSFASRPTGLRYAYQAIVDSDLSFFVSTGNPVHAAGDPIRLSAALAIKGRPVRKAQVQAEIAGFGPGFDNWLASQSVTDAEYAAALKALGIHDVQAQFVKTLALAAKGIRFPGTGSSLVKTLEQDHKSGAYTTTFGSTTLPGSYQFLVTATGQDELGNSFQRQKIEQVVIAPLPDQASSIVSVTYQLVGTAIQATLRFWPRDRFGNVYLVDPTLNQTIQVLLQGGATAAGPLQGKLDGSYVQIFTYPVGTNPTVSITVGGIEIAPPFTPPDLSKLLYVNEVVDFVQGAEWKKGTNTHKDPSKALGDPSRKPPTDFVSLGGRGALTCDVKGRSTLHPRSVTVFVASDTSPRAYAVDVLSAQHCGSWIEIGRSSGVTQTFGLVPQVGGGCGSPSPKGSYVEVEGNVGGETFDVKVSLDGKLKATAPDPLQIVAQFGIAQVRVRDLSDVVTNPDRTPSVTPGVSISGIGFAI